MNFPFTSLKDPNPFGWMDFKPLGYYRKSGRGFEICCDLITRNYNHCRRDLLVTTLNIIVPDCPVCPRFKFFFLRIRISNFIFEKADNPDNWTVVYQPTIIKSQQRIFLWFTNRTISYIALRNTIDT